MTGTPTIVVVGTGIVGAAIGWHLTARGAAVVLVDGEAAAGGRATPASWAWINASWGNTLPYYRLRRASMAAWRRLEAAVPGLAVDWCGGLVFDLPLPELEAFAVDHAAWGYPLQRLEAAAIAALEPALRPPPLAVLCPDEGVIDPVAATAALLADAAARGARVSTGTPVTAIAVAGGRAVGVETAAGTIAADAVVVAAGTGAPALLAPLGGGVPLKPAPGLIVRSQPLAIRLRHAVVAPGLELRQTADGALLVAGDLLADDPDGARSAAHRMALAAALLDGDTTPEVVGFTLGERPMPVDGHPFVGAVPGIAGLFAAVTHSGVTLAAGIGAMVTEEIVDGAAEPLLAPYRPGRL